MDPRQTHPSVLRLLEFARSKTSTDPDPIETERDLREYLGIGDAVFTNWKARGISKEGAIVAADTFGCSSRWLRDGTGGPEVLPPAASPSYAGPRLARRQHWLKVLVEEQGGAARVADAAGTPASHISAMTAGRRGIGDLLSDRLEAAFGKPNGWLDQPADHDPLANVVDVLKACGDALERMDPDSSKALAGALTAFVANPRAGADFLPLIARLLRAGASGA